MNHIIENDILPKKTKKFETKPFENINTRMAAKLIK